MNSELDDSEGCGRFGEEGSEDGDDEDEDDDSSEVVLFCDVCDCLPFTFASLDFNSEISCFNNFTFPESSHSDLELVVGFFSFSLSVCTTRLLHSANQGFGKFPTGTGRTWHIFCFLRHEAERSENFRCLRPTGINETKNLFFSSFFQ